MLRRHHWRSTALTTKKIQKSSLTKEFLIVYPLFLTANLEIVSDIFAGAFDKKIPGILFNRLRIRAVEVMHILQVIQTTSRLPIVNYMTPTPASLSKEKTEFNFWLFNSFFFLL